uniref:VWFD domain-containing protein n=1 Tax=Callorhinchus milii TaxID=7868 RepID=A0A4W3HVQ1_CALMI
YAECQPIGGAVCWASGDPHYSTFDGQKYDFQGTCKYTIAKTCGTETSLPSFKVEAKNANRGSTKVSYVDLVNIYVYDLNITVETLDKFPYSTHTPTPLFTSGKYGSYMLLETDFDLKVKYDWNHHLEVRVTSSFQDRLCGLCGNYNGKPDDDFKTPGGQVASAPNDFAASWKVNDGDKACWDNCKGKCPVCDERNRQKYQSVRDASNARMSIDKSSVTFLSCRVALPGEERVQSLCQCLPSHLH